MAGGLLSAVAVVQAKYMAAGDPTATTVTMADGASVAVNACTGIQTGTAAGIGAAMQSLDGFTISRGKPRHSCRGGIARDSRISCAFPTQFEGACLIYIQADEDQPAQTAA